jgi:hypothetical protein
VSSREMLCSLITSRDLQMLFAAVTHFVEGMMMMMMIMSVDRFGASGSVCP